MGPAGRLAMTEAETGTRSVLEEAARELEAAAYDARVAVDCLALGAKGTFVRVLKPRVEGMLVQGQQGLDVGDGLKAKLVRTDVQRGYIDFARA